MSQALQTWLKFILTVAIAAAAPVVPTAAFAKGGGGGGTPKCANKLVQACNEAQAGVSSRQQAGSLNTSGTTGSVSQTSQAQIRASAEGGVESQKCEDSKQECEQECKKEGKEAVKACMAAVGGVASDM